MKSNYAAWHIKPEEFSETMSDIEKLRFFARYAILAPSGHNTQPWAFSATKDSLILTIDEGRKLPHSGVQANEPYVSIGACIESLVSAAKGYGYLVDLNYDLTGTFAAKFSLGSRIKPESAIPAAITQRVSNRNHYSKTNLSAKVISELADNSLKDVSLTVLSAHEDLEFIADQTDLATHRTFGDKEFRAELSKWVRNNKTKKHDGMPGFVQGIPTPPSMIGRHIVKHINVSKDQSKKDSQRILNSANLIIVSAKNQKKQSLINAGRAYSRICILASEKSIASSGIGTAAIDPTSQAEIIKKFKIDGHPIAILRLGVSKSGARHSPRWPLEKVSK
jgi:nitroreductase